MGEHDAFFKQVFEHPARAAGLVRSIVPADVTRVVDLEAFTHVPGSFVDAALDARHADILFRTKLRSDEPGGPSTAYVYFLLEHQSDPDPLMPFRVLGYMVRIWERHRRDHGGVTLPPIVPIVIHHGGRGWKAPRHFHQLVPALEAFPALARFVPRFVLALDDLTHHSDQLLLARPLDALARLALWALRDGRDDTRFLVHVAAWDALLVRLARHHDEEDLFVFLSYLFRVLHVEAARSVTRHIVDIAPDTEPTMVSYAEFLEEQGRAKGRQEGQALAKRTVLLQLMTAKFGTLAEHLTARIEAAPEADLDAGLERILSAASADDVLR